MIKNGNRFYLADGRKFRDGGRYFLGSFVFTISSNAYVVQSTAHSQGVFLFASGSVDPDPVFHVKDHTGSVRVVYSGVTGIVAKNDYYPFGGRHGNPNLQSAALEKNRWWFNGKEAKEDYILSTLDYGWRIYDPYIGRWLSQDPEYQFQNRYRVNLKRSRLNTFQKSVC